MTKGYAPFLAGLLAGFLASCTVLPLQDVPITVPSSQTGQTLPSASALPKQLHLGVPFSTQAPYADWADPRQQEGCEEMSLMMVAHYLEGTDILDRQQALDELMTLSDWEEQHEYPLDVHLDQLAMIAKQYYGYDATVIEDVTFKRIQEELAAGHPIIVPAAGRDLGNPYFSGAGPWYHMLVITGYDGKRFITNDPGTRRGQDYRYDYRTLLNAIHDWTGVKEEIRTGRKVMLILRKAASSLSPGRATAG